MPENDSNKQKKVYDKFNNDVQLMIIFSKAASINANVDCIYPESLVVGLLTMGVNDVSSSLIRNNIDLEKCLKVFKTRLIERKGSKKNSEYIGYDSLKISRGVIETCKLADQISIENNMEQIGIQHVFLALLKIYPDIKKFFTDCNLNMNEFTEEMKKIKPREVAVPKNQPASKQNTKSTSALEAFCINMTQMAADDQYDPIIARENEIEEAITVLCRRNKSNPILVGEPGVGKTAVVEGICQRIISKTIPKKLYDSKIYSLNLGAMVAGTKYRGEFEKRLQTLLKELKDNTNIILFIDEIHSVIGAGSASGSLDAADMLKPALAKGLRCIGATTNAEHKKIFSGDGALDRRFEKIDIDQPSEENVKKILMGIKPKLEAYHKCIITDDAIDTAIRLSSRYKPSKNFPDKAIDVIDTACAEYAWKEDKNAQITAHDVAMVISKQCNVPIEIIMWSSYERIKNTETTLKNSIIGQDHALSSVCRVLKNSYSGMRNPQKPIGIFVFGGQSGTGKTYMAKELAKALFDNESSFIRLDMTEFSESHSVSKIIGSPPGYIGFNEVNVIADRIRRKPYCVLLLDEIEKAHPDVVKVFLQVMGEGFFTDSVGNKVNCKNIIMIMTGNFGMNEKSKTGLGFKEDSAKSDLEKEKARMVDYCKKLYGVEFINRIDDFIPFMPLSDETLNGIAKLQLNALSKRIVGKCCSITFADDVPEAIVKLGKNEHGVNAMNLDRMISSKIEPCLADILLTIEDQDAYTISLEVNNGEFSAKKHKTKKSTKIHEKLP